MYSTTKPIINVVGVSDTLYDELQKQFDLKMKNIHTGRKDGTNRKIFRNEVDKTLYDEDKKLVIPMSKVKEMMTGSQKMTKFAKAVMTADSEFEWIYDDKKNIAGCKWKSGYSLKSSEFYDMVDFAS